MIDTRMASMPIWAQGEDDHSGAPRDLISQISNSTGTIRSALGRGTQHGRPGKIWAPRSKAESSLCSGRRPLLRDRAFALASPQRDDAGVGRGRAHAAVMGLRGAREADGILRARLGRAHARELFSDRRSAPRLTAKLLDDIWAFCDPFLKV